jgi:hypothetical protein
MRKQFLNILVLFCAACVSFTAQAQHNRYSIYAEGHPDQVKLLWLPTVWPSNLTGFDIKKRPAGGNEGWQPVNASYIFPELSFEKDLSNIDNNSAEQQRLQKKLKKLIADKKVRPTPNKAYLAKLQSDSTAVTALFLPISLDYDFALLNGFGMVDRNVKAGEYEYGLFLHNADNSVSTQPVATVKVSAGAEPEIKIPVDFSFKTAAVKTKLQLVWKINSAAYKKLLLNGFNIYRKDGKTGYAKLNATPLWPNLDKETSTSFLMNEDLKPNVIYQYTIAPVSLFGTEGERTELTYDPSQLPGDITPPELENLPQPADAGNGLVLGWKFDPKSEKDIKGFYLARKTNVDSQYTALTTTMLPPSARSYSDNKGLKRQTYYFYRLSAIRTDGAIFRSREVLVYYTPVLRPAAPIGLKAKWVQEGKRKFIQLEWAARNPQDTLTEGYRLYASFPPGETMAWKASIPLIKENTYKYEVFNPYAANFKFAVTAVSKYSDESRLSDSVQVLSPTTTVPFVGFQPVKVDSNRVTLQWDYEKLADLKGFRILKDGTAIATENELGPDSRKWVSPALPYGGTYVFQIMAVTKYDQLSDKSLPVSIPIAKKKQQP